MSLHHQVTVSVLDNLFNANSMVYSCKTGQGRRLLMEHHLKTSSRWRLTLDILAQHPSASMAAVASICLDGIG